VVRLGELVVILDLHRQGLSLSAIARQTGLDRKTVRRYVERGLEPPAYQPRPTQASKVTPFGTYLRARVAAYPELTASRLHRELRDLGFGGGYTAVKVFVRGIRPGASAGFEVRFETPPGRQAQVDFAHFRTVFTDEPGVERVVWLFSLVLGHSRMLWGRFVAQQDMQTVLRCHAAAFEALGGAPAEILYDRMKTVVDRKAPQDGPEAGHIVYNRTLVEFARHHGYLPKACKAYRAKTKGKVERPFRYIREDFFLGRSFRNRDDLNGQFRQWLDEVANPSVGIPTASRPEPWPTPPGCTPPHTGWSASTSPRSVPACSRCRPDRSRPCCAWNGGLPRTAWCRSMAISTAYPTRPGAALSRCTAPPMRSASSKRARLSRCIP